MGKRCKENKTYFKSMFGELNGKYKRSRVETGN